MWIWVIIIAIVLILLLVFKFKEIRHKFGLIIIAGILVFLFLSFINVYKSVDKVDLKSFDGISKVAKVYFSWLGNIFSNAKQITGYAIHQDWGIKDKNVTKAK